MVQSREWHRKERERDTEIHTPALYKWTIINAPHTILHIYTVHTVSQADELQAENTLSVFSIFLYVLKSCPVCKWVNYES